MIVIGKDDYSEKIASLLGLEHRQFIAREFADGELCPKIPDCENEVIMVNRMECGKPNNFLMETFLIAMKMKEMGVKSHFALPYIPYSRQDSSKKDEPSSAEYIFTMLGDAAISNVFTISSHYNRRLEVIWQKPCIYNISGTTILLKKIQELGKRTVLLSPDKGAADIVGEIAEKLGLQFHVLSKKRNEDGILTTGSSGTGDIFCIIDDLVSTGRTMINAAEAIRQENRNAEIQSYCIHNVTMNPVKNLHYSNSIINARPEISTEEFMASQIKIVLAKRLMI